ncbi:tRNA (adenosine(37)-N6)-dimethylallyltransferase MiaA [Culturomica massiliensis]|jgi:tRNA dimethylallyltransferase|uniref:tRNA (adenosine(37)-N6)-dimethylallyltransferase MiaA n=1 Tax=Culturomica massiliensis TaxID=1841857 RepID=UPI000E55DE62|nr:MULTISPECIES: tRNA (adenosine(37)-N6)-dimethylallyltransferase MiaA [Odoribacteraceae]RHV93637.1 tRNA (adenosine(37)-N6)-dimethylallyltransferase MiaA [Odoribacter sp. OF09-27XD]
MFNLLCVLGPTASGKTALAVRMAAELGGEVISADSRQVYRGMDIGTGKDLEEYDYEGRSIPYHLIDIVDAGYKYNVFEYQQDFVKVWKDCKNRNVFPVLCGGSGLYLEAVLKAYRLLAVPVNEALRKTLENKSLSELSVILSAYKRMHNTTDVDTVKRAVRAIEIEEYYKLHSCIEGEFPEIHPLIVGVDVSREVRRTRIDKRLQERLKNGMVEEVQRLLEQDIAPEDLIYYGLEYKYLTLYLTGQLTYEDMVEKLNIAIHQFAKRQMTWFRKMERQGFSIHWIDGNLPMDEKVMLIRELMETGCQSSSV